ncbi:protein kinase domain-containing protein [Archangium sp.]|uniref:protein kinase domain-containing protein n=1 Tax=Archangium sp. TaxID=1872627 RepID=UPI002D640BC1|nr:protein kinase [Archangium sp.]HYO54065.1 protein kinase [Archangium sp.]
MPGDGPGSGMGMQEDGIHGEQGEDLLLEESDFGDSLLRKVARVQVPFLAPRPGEHMGGRDGRRFEILDELGGGGMGLVFRARDEELQRVVALKFLLPRQELAGLALREARAIAQLDHENIIRIFDVAEWSPGLGAPRVPFLVMECLAGESLARLLARERPGPRRSLDIMASVASGLAHAHEHHVIHRDLKPSNIFLSQHGTVKLLDFGLAHLEASGPGPAPLLPTSGTPAYMAPEQWRGERQDARADIWAAGVLLYELLTGELPYPPGPVEELRARVLSPEPVPPLRAHHPELPWELEPLLAIALAKEPARRLLSAAELRDELRELAEHLWPRRGGARLLVPQRRQVTLVCCKLAGLSEELDPEDFGELEAAFHRSCSDIIQQHGGFITLCLGDEVLGCFGYPVVHEEDSERAVRAGLSLAASLPDLLRARLAGLPLRALAVKVGIRTDLVVLDDTLPELRGRTPTFQGEAPRVAAWLARQAGPGEVVIGDTTHRLVSPIFETVPLGVRTWEGTRQFNPHRVVRARQEVLRFERALAQGRRLSPLVGREREVRLLLGHWERAQRGQGSLLLVEGEAGIGKSRLLQELQERVSSEQVLHLRLQCWSQFSTSAFHPLIEELRRLWVVPGHSPRETLRAVESWLEAVGLPPVQVRLVASLLGLPVAEDSPHLQLTPERRREETLEALATLLRTAAEARPVLVVVEDLHWADPSTLQMLGFLLERVRRSRVLGVLSARPEFQPPWARGPGFQVLTLERLPAQSTARLAKEVAEGRVLPEEEVAEMVARTDGIPLFVEELTRLMLESASVAGSIPVTLRELLMAKLDLLPRRQKSLVQLCAVVGRSFSQSLLERLAGDGGPTLWRDLTGLMLAGLLQRQDEPDGTRYQFRHALFQEAALQALMRGVRRQHHRRIARVLEEDFPEVAEDQPELLAHHYTEAGEVEPALGYWKQAGLRASQRSANVEAVSHLTQALKLLRGLPDTPRRAEEELRLLLALGLPLVQVKGYSAPEVERTYVRAKELLSVVGDALPRLELSFWGIYSYFFTQKRYCEAHSLAERLVELGGRQHHREMLAVGHRMMAYDFVSWGRMTEGLEHISRALVYSEADLEQHRVVAVRQVVNPRVVALAFGALAYSAAGPLEVAVRHSEEALVLARRIGHPHTLAFALHYSADACQFRGEAAGCLKWAEECIALSREHRFRLWVLWSSLLRSWALAWLGRPEEGLALMREGLASWDKSGLLTGKPHNLGLLADIHLRLGQAREGLAVLEEALEPESLRGEHFYEAELYRIRGELLRLLGREEEARESFTRGMHLAHEQGAYAFESRARAALE